MTQDLRYGEPFPYVEMVKLNGIHKKKKIPSNNSVRTNTYILRKNAETFLHGKPFPEVEMVKLNIILFKRRLRLTALLEQIHTN